MVKEGSKEGQPVQTQGLCWLPHWWLVRSPEDLQSPENCPLVSTGGFVDTHALGCNHREESARGLEEDPHQGQALGLAPSVESGPQKYAL